MAAIAQTAPSVPVEDRSFKDGGPAVWLLALLALALSTEYRFRVDVSASIPELCTYLAIAAVLAVRTDAPTSAGTRRLWTGFALLTLLLVARAFYFKIGRKADLESPFGHLRDLELPVFFVLLVQQRLRLGVRGQRIIAHSLLLMGAVSGAVGISQFFTGGPYLFEGVDAIRYKTLFAQKYWLATILHLDVQNLARGFYGFSLGYASAMVVPAVVCFALAIRGSARQRLPAAIAFALLYAGIYLSFARSIVGILPFGCFLAWRAIEGKLRPLTCAGVVFGYLFVAYGLPLLHLSEVNESDLGTLNSRAATIAGFFTHVARDPSVLLYGTHVALFREFNDLSPHNWVLNAMLYDGVPCALLRIAIYVGIFVELFPVRRGFRCSPLRAGLWCGSFTLLCVVGETEPFTGIAEYLMAAFGLSVLAACRASDDEAWLGSDAAPRLRVLPALDPPPAAPSIGD